MNSINRYSNKLNNIKLRLCILGLIICVALNVFGAFAFIIDTKSIINNLRIESEFGIEVIEPLYDTERVSNPSYGTNLMPMQEVIKDPKIANRSNLSAYIVCEIKVPIYTGKIHNSIGNTINVVNYPIYSFDIKPGWTILNRERLEDGYKIFTYLYDGIVEPNSQVDVFDKVVVANLIDTTSFTNGVNLSDLTITAYGIQSKGFDSVVDAYTTYLLQNGSYQSNLLSYQHLEEYSLSDLKLIAQDSSRNDIASPYYNKFHNFLLNGETKMIDLNPNNLSLPTFVETDNPQGNRTFNFTVDNNKIRVRIIGINHDKSSNGNSNGLTFMATNILPITYWMDVNWTNAGGWEQRTLRQLMNSGEIYNFFDDELKSFVCPTVKTSISDRLDNTQYCITTDDFFLPSVAELYGKGVSAKDSSNVVVSTTFYDINDGEQYEFFKSIGLTSSYYTPLMNLQFCKTWDGLEGIQWLGKREWISSTAQVNIHWWSRSVSIGNQAVFLRIQSQGAAVNAGTKDSYGIVPTFCF